MEMSKEEGGQERKGKQRSDHLGLGGRGNPLRVYPDRKVESTKAVKQGSGRTWLPRLPGGE